MERRHKRSCHFYNSTVSEPIGVLLSFVGLEFKPFEINALIVTMLIVMGIFRARPTKIITFVALLPIWIVVYFAFAFFFLPEERVEESIMYILMVFTLYRISDVFINKYTNPEKTTWAKITVKEKILAFSPTIFGVVVVFILSAINKGLSA
jgi:hypothetical protein